MYIVVQCGLSQSIIKHKKGGLSPSGSAYVSLRGWSFDSERDLEVFFRNKYSGQVMSKNKINNETNETQQKRILT
jgi:hypothetical protein